MGIRFDLKPIHWVVELVHILHLVHFLKCTPLRAFFPVGKGGGTRSSLKGVVPAGRFQPTVLKARHSIERAPSRDLPPGGWEGGGGGEDLTKTSQESGGGKQRTRGQRLQETVSPGEGLVQKLWPRKGKGQGPILPPEGPRTRRISHQEAGCSNSLGVDELDSLGPAWSP